MRPALAAILFGSQRPVALLDFQTGRFQIGASSGSSFLDLPGATFTRASAKTALDSQGNVISFASGVPAITDLGLLPEETRTNSLLNSNAPATQTTASLATGTYTLWVAGSGSAAVTAGTGTATGLGTASAGSFVTFTVTVAGTFTVTVTGSLSFFQLENGAAPTSRIITAGTTVTRAADVATITGMTAQAGTLYFEGMPTDDPSTGSTARGLASLNDNSGNNRTSMFRGTSATPGLTFRNVVAGVATNPAIVAQSGTGLIKAALAFSASSSLGAANGIVSASAGAPASLAPWTQLQIGLDLTVPQFNGYVRKLVLYPRVFSSAELASLTT